VKRASYWVILLLTLFIGFVLGYQRSVVARSSYVLTSRKGQLIAQIEQKESDLSRLKEEVHFPQVTPSTQLETNLEQQKMKLGFSEISGPGLIITLADSKQKPKPDDDPNYYRVGADGIAVNDQRIVFNSEIVCAGPTSLSHLRCGRLRDTYGLVFQLETSSNISLPGRPVEVLMSAK